MALTIQSCCPYIPPVRSNNAIETRAIAPDDGVGNGEHPAPSTFQLTEPQFRTFLSQLAESAGSNAELGRRLDVSGQLIDTVLSGKRRPGPKLLSKLGASVERVYKVVVEAETNGTK